MDDKRVAVVTGSATGIGLATARQLCRQGVITYMVDVSPLLAAACQGVNDDGGQGNAKAYPCDITDEAAVTKMMESIIASHGRLDILINNAGLWRCDRGEFCKSDSAMWKKKIAVNILGTMYCTRAVINQMIAQKYGRIINLGSVAGVYGNKNMVDYSMTKGAISSFSLALSKEVAAYGITVNTVSPGNVKSTPQSPDHLELSYVPRSQAPEETAELICYLAGDKASYITGQNYLIDGGRKAM